MRKTFDEIVLFARTGLNPRTNFQLGRGKNKYITIKNIRNNTMTFDDGTDVIDDDALRLIHKRSQIRKGDILFCSIGRMGDMFIIENDPVGWDINESVFAFTLDTDVIRQKFFYYMFKNREILEYLNRNSSGSTFKSIKMNQLKKLVFDLPTLEEQDRIIAGLDCASRMMEEKRGQLFALDSLVKARFVEMFGDMADPARKWETHRLVDVCTSADDIKCGPFGTQLGKDEYTKDGIAVWEIPQINSEFKIPPSHFVTAEKARMLDAYSIRPGDIAMSRKGNVGRCAIFPVSLADGIIHSDVLRIRVDGAKVNSEFLMRQLHYSGDVQHQIELVSAGAIMAGINVTKLKQIRVCIPPKALQERFAAFVAQVDKSKSVVQKSLEETQLLFNSLMQKYFG